MKKILSVLVIIILPILVLGLIGFFSGMSVGGNLSGHVTESCVNTDGSIVCTRTCTNTDGTERGGSCDWSYMGLPGYEGGGILGLHIGVLLGLLVGTFIWRRRRSKR